MDNNIEYQNEARRICNSLPFREQDYLQKQYAYDGIMKAFEYAEKRALDKMCELLDKKLSGYIIRNFNFGDAYRIEDLINDLRKAIEE